jgi:mono/diheme cytochrome c family protein
MMKNHILRTTRIATLGLAAVVSSFAGLSLSTPALAADDLQPMTYAVGQAAGGRANYMKACASCHGNELEGSGAPGLTGESFSHWVGAPVADLFEYIQVQMPADRPGSLSNAQVATIIAYLAQQNGVEAGGAPVPNDLDALKGLSFGQ